MNTKKCPHCHTDISDLAKKCPNCQSDLRNWFRRHPVLVVILGIIGFPFALMILVGFVTGFTESRKETTIETRPLEERSAEALLFLNNEDAITMLTEIDTANGYGTYNRIVVEIGRIDRLANLVIELEESEKEEDKAIAVQLREKLVEYQKTAYPELRKKYTKYLDTEFWEDNVDVETSGTKSSTIVLTGGVFTSNANIKESLADISGIVKKLRFQRMNYKWYSGDTEYTYFDLPDIPTDGEIVTTEE